MNGEKNGMETLVTKKVSIVLRPVPKTWGFDYGKRKNTSKSTRTVYALRCKICFNG